MRTALLVLIAAVVLAPVAAWAFAGSASPQAIAPGSIPAAASAPVDGWETSWQAAAARARSERRPVLAFFTGSDWCSWCHRLEGEVFSSPVFQRWAQEAVVPLLIDFPRAQPQPASLQQQNAALQRALAVRGYPTVVLLDADGRELGRLGYRRGGAEPWVAEARRIVAQPR